MIVDRVSAISCVLHYFATINLLKIGKIKVRFVTFEIDDLLLVFIHKGAISTHPLHLS
jgi:hypothetical protein